MLPEMGISYYDGVYGEKGKRYNNPYRMLYEAVTDKVTQGACVLDIGCGPGGLSQHLKDIASSYTGIDFSPVAVTIAENHAPDNAEFICEDIFLFKWVDRPYDTVIITEVIEHTDRALEIVNRVRTGSKIIITVPYNEPLRPDGFPAGYPVHRRTFKEDTLQNDWGALISFDKANITGRWLIHTGNKLGGIHVKG